VIPVVLGSLAVYAAAAGLACWAAHRWVLPLGRPMALVIALLPLLFTGRALTTGRIFAPIDVLFNGEPFLPLKAEHGIPAHARTPLLSDVSSSMIPWHQAVRESITSGRLPLWNRFVLSGEPLLAVQQHAALHPGTWFALLLPAAQGWTFLMTLRLFIALLAGYLFSREIGCGQAPSLLGAAAWGFSDTLVFWLGYPVNASLGPFPLLLLGLNRLARDADRRAVFLTAAALVLIVTAGHPETLLFSVAGGGVYFLFRLGAALPGRRLRPVLLSVLAGLAALGLTAVQLLPLAEVMPQTWEHAFRRGWYANVEKSAELADSARRGLTVLLPFAYGESGQTRLWKDFGPPGIYAGSLLFPLAAVALGSRGRQRWALLTLGLLGAALWARLALVTDAVAALPLFDIGVLDYLGFLAVFALAALAALGADRLARGEATLAFSIACILTAAAIVGAFAFRRAGLVDLGMRPEFARARLLWALGPLLAAVVVVAACRRGARLPAAAPLLLGLFLAARVAEAGSVYPTYPASAFYPPLSALDAVPRDAPFRFVGLGSFFVPNAAAMYGLEDVRGYESLTLWALRRTYPLWCVDQRIWFNRVDDLTKPFLSFLNVRYALVPPGALAPAGWTRIASGQTADLLENGGVLARAFVPASVLEEPDLERRVEALGGISDFAGRGIVASSSGVRTDWKPNGRARVAISSYRAQSMDLEIEADDETVIGTSIPGWLGWQARLDGVRIVPLSYNHAFLGFRVPPGTHRLTLRYLPDAFVAGAAVSLATLVVLATFAVAGFRRQRISSRP
jgi:hypothetical protein